MTKRPGLQTLVWSGLSVYLNSIPRIPIPPYWVLVRSALLASTIGPRNGRLAHWQSIRTIRQVLYNVACVYSLVGETDQAFDILEKVLPGFAEEFYKWFKNDSDLDPIRSHPRYEKLLRLIE